MKSNQNAASLQGDISITQESGKQRLTVCHPVLDSVIVNPYRCPRRKRSVIDQQIITHRLHQLCADGKVSLVKSIDCRTVLKVVLVDKTKEGPRVHPDSDSNIRKR